MNFLALKIPPLIVLILFSGCMWLTSNNVDSDIVNTQYNIAILLSTIMIALVIVTASAYSFKKSKTTVNPTVPSESSALVTSGIYRYTRNPMYLSFALILMGWSAYLSTLQFLIYVPLFIIYMNYLQIKPEEKALLKIFGQTYLDYKNNVRRWI